MYSTMSHSKTLQTHQQSKKDVQLRIFLILLLNFNF
jgi:hypothetical protein